MRLIMTKYRLVVLCATLAAPMAFGTISWAADDEVAATFGYTDAKASSVGVAGEFNDWTILPMTKDAGGKWTKTLYLKPGYYGYKFIVDGTDWVLDPANPVRKLVNDIENSGISVGGVQGTSATAATVTFTHVNTTAKTVHVAGEFNNWLDPSDGKITGKPEWQMQNDGAGNWKLTTQLKPGRYKFKYVINNGEAWELDKVLPASTDGNSVIEAKAEGAQPAAAPAPAPAPAAPAAPTPATGNASFNYVDPAAKSVSVAGEFNNWNAKANPLQKDATGIWTATVQLKPGKYQYKFVVNDTDWLADPANPETVTDPQGNVNSVRVVSQ